jgi:hypothetical protein
MNAKVSFNIETDRYDELCSLLGQLAETLSGDSIIGHSNAYTIERVFNAAVATSNSLDGPRTRWTRTRDDALEVLACAGCRGGSCEKCAGQWLLSRRESMPLMRRKETYVRKNGYWRVPVRGTTPGVS